MNSNRRENENNYYGNNYQTHRSERYRHPERDNNYRYDDYGSATHGGYGNEGYGETWGNQGNEMGGSRHVANHDLHGSTYSTWQNSGNMGSYGGAQGFGDVRGGSPQQRRSYSDHNSNFDSGMGSGREQNRDGRHRSYGYQSDDDSHGNGMGSNAQPDLYGSETSRRFQGRSGQENYNLNRNEYDSPNYGGDQGNYMGSGYDRIPRGDYGSTDGNYGTIGNYDQGRLESDEPYGSSGYYSGGYGNRESGLSYIRPGSDYIRSSNRDRTFDGSIRRERDYNNDRF